MPKYLDTRGKSTLGIGVCARCNRKMSLTELHPDPNAIGLMVCVEDLDVLDPYRKAPRAADQIVLMYARPDVQLYPGPVQIPINRMQAAVEVTETDTVSRQDGLSDGYYGELIESSPLAGIAVSPATTVTITPATGIMGVDETTEDGVAAAPPVSQNNPSTPWAANRYYPLGAVVTNIPSSGIDSVGAAVYAFIALVPGTSGATAPTWTPFLGVTVIDNGVIWMGAGPYANE